MAHSSSDIRAFISRYAERMDEAVRAGTIDSDYLASCFADAFVGAGPTGIMSGKNDGLGEVIAAGAGAYRAMGGTAFVAEHIDVEELAPNSFMARVDWRFDYRRPNDGKNGTIGFTNHYLISTAGGRPKIFAWITPDEQAALRQHGLIPAAD